MGFDGYDAGAKILYDFFKQELPKYLTADLNPVGKRVIEACLDYAPVEQYNTIVPMDYKYSFLTMGEIEHGEV